MAELGIYTSIIEANVPANANAGDNVHVDVVIQNLYNFTISVALRVLGVLGYDGENVPFVEKNLSAYNFDTFSVDFPMPSYGQDVDITIQSLVYTTEGYYVDAFVTRRIVLGSVPPTLEWQKLAERFVAVGVPPAAGWQKLAEKSLVIQEGVSIPADFQLIQHADFPAGKTYKGTATQVTATFWIIGNPGITPNSWASGLLASAFEAAANVQGIKMLSVDIYQKVGLLTTDFMVVATGYQPTPVGAVGFVISATLWTIIIVAACVILGLVALTFALVQVKEIIWGIAEIGKTTGGTVLLIGIGVAVAIGGVVLLSSSQSKSAVPA